MPKPLYQARYRGKPEWKWEYTTRGYTVTYLEMAKKPTYKWLEEAKKRNKPLQVQVVIVDPEKRWGEVMWEDFYLKEEFWKGSKETERCQIVKDITKDLLEEECQTEDDKCKIAKEITEDIISRECEGLIKKDIYYKTEYEEDVSLISGWALPKPSAKYTFVHCIFHPRLKSILEAKYADSLYIDCEGGLQRDTFDREDIDDAFYNFLQKDFVEGGYFVEYVNEDTNYMYFKLIDKKTNKKSRIIELSNDRLCKEVSVGRSKHLAREVIEEL